MTHTLKQSKMTHRRAVAPVIATLLLVAIAVVGGSLVFIFSQGFFSQSQVSGTPTIESLEIKGYDARDAVNLDAHTGSEIGVAMGASGVTGSEGLNTCERIATFVQNQSTNKVTFSEVRLAGSVYSYQDAGGTTVPAYGNGCTYPTAADPPRFWIVTNAAGDTIDATAAELEPGQQATLVLELDQDIREGRDAQLKLTTANGAVFVGTIVMGQQSG